MLSYESLPNAMMRIEKHPFIPYTVDYGDGSPRDSATSKAHPAPSTDKEYYTMTRLEKAKSLRADDNPVHYNCAQTLTVAFADALGKSEKEAFDLAAFYGSGMMHGATCGTVAAAMMILGAAGCPREDATKLLQDFRHAHESTQCTDLLKRSHARGIPKKQHCDDLIFEMAERLEHILRPS